MRAPPVGAAVRRFPPPSTGDLLAGFTVALVLIPQSLAYAVLAGMPAHTGLIVGGVATIAAAPFVSSPMLQTGPTAITSMLTFGSLTVLAAPGSPRYVAAAALLALLVGLVRIGIGLVRAGDIAYMLSEPVLTGFTSAAALVIALSQVPDMVDVATDSTNIMANAVAALSAPSSWNLEAVGLSIATLVLVLGARRLHPLVPGVLLAVMAGVVLEATVGYSGDLVGDIPVRLPLPGLPGGWDQLGGLVVPAVVIALVGFVEASAVARSIGEQAAAAWDPDREFVSQGIANVASGLFGGFPAGGSFSRSALNRLAGATSAWSGAITGVVLLLFLPFVDLLAGLPRAVLAAIIVGAVVRLMDPRPALELRHYSRQQHTIALITFVLTLALAPRIHWAVLTGIVLSVGAHLRRERYLSSDHWRDGEELHVRPVGVVYFGSAQRLERQVDDLRGRHEDARRLVLHLDAVGRTDVTGAMVLRSIARAARDHGLEVLVTDLRPPSRKIVTRVLSDVEGVIVEPPATDR